MHKIAAVAYAKFQQNQAMRGWDIDDSVSFHGPFSGADLNRLFFRGVKRLKSISEGEKTIECFLDFRYAASFRNGSTLN